MKTTDQIVSMTRQEQVEMYQSLSDDDRRKLWTQLGAEGHTFLFDRMAADFQILSTGAAVGHPRHGLYEELIEDFRQKREHAAEIERRIAAGSTEYGKGSK